MPSVAQIFQKWEDLQSHFHFSTMAQTPRKISDIRDANFRFLLTKFADENPGPALGLLRRISRTLGLDENLLSQLKIRKRTIGPKTARKLEEAFGMPVGWLDSEHEEFLPRDVTEKRLMQRLLKRLRQLHDDNAKLEMIEEIEQLIERFDRLTKLL